jgi:hypothetical protein
MAMIRPIFGGFQVLARFKSRAPRLRQKGLQCMVRLVLFLCAVRFARARLISQTEGPIAVPLVFSP